MHIRVSLGSRSFCTSLALFGHTWANVGISGPVRAYLGICGPVGDHLGLSGQSGTIWAYVALLGTIWAFPREWLLKGIVALATGVIEMIRLISGVFY